MSEYHLRTPITEKDVREFLTAIVHKLNESDITSLFIVDKGSHEEKIEESLKSSFEGVLDLEIQKIKEKDEVKIQSRMGIIKLPEVKTGSKYFDVSIKNNVFELV